MLRQDEIPRCLGILFAGFLQLQAFFNLFGNIYKFMYESRIKIRSCAFSYHCHCLLGGYGRHGSVLRPTQP